MPQSSRYSDEHVEQLLSEMVNVLEKHRAPTDLALMVLGNMVTNLINTSIAPAQRQVMARSFAEALQASIKKADKATKGIYLKYIPFAAAVNYFVCEFLECNFIVIVASPYITLCFSAGMCCRRKFYGDNYKRPFK